MTSAPGCTKCFAIKNSSCASNATVALSVSTSAMTSPTLTLSPSFLPHDAIVPDVIVGDSAGMFTS